MSACCGGWRAEFAGRQVDYDVPDIIAALPDQSWHNDACPSFGVYAEGPFDLDLKIWVEAPDYDDRESGGTERFCVQCCAWSEPDAIAILDSLGLEDAQTGAWGFTTDDPAAALAEYNRRLALLHSKGVRFREIDYR